MYAAVPRTVPASVNVEQRGSKTYYQLNLASAVRVGAKGQHLGKNPAEVRCVTEANVPDDEWTFDIETESGIFCAGFGRLVISNSPRRGLEFVTRKAGMPVDRFQPYWSRIHGPLAALIPGVRRYVQSHTRRSAYEAGRAPLYDGVAVTWFDDAEAMRASAATPECARVRADEGHVITRDPPFILTTEHPIIA